MKSSKKDEIKERKSERKINSEINLFGILFNNDSLWSRLVECSHFETNNKNQNRGKLGWFFCSNDNR